MMDEEKAGWYELRNSFRTPPSMRVMKALYDAGARCLADAANKSEVEWLIEHRNFGRISLNELKRHLRGMGKEFPPSAKWCSGCQSTQRFYGTLCDSCSSSLRPTPHQPWNEVLF